MSNVTTLQSNYNIITNNNLTIDDILETINNLPEAGSGEPTLQEKTISPSTSSQTVRPDTGYDGLSQVTVNKVTSSIDSNIVASNIKNGVSILGVTGTLEEGLFIDYSPDFNEPNTAIATQETTIDQIAAALEGKAAGSTEDLSTELTEQDTLLNTQTSKLSSVLTALEGKTSGGGLSGENVTLTVNYNLSSSKVAAYLTYIYYDDNNTLVGGYNNFVNSSSSTSVPVAKGSYVHITADGITTGTRIDNSTLTTEALESPNSEIIQVNEEGSLTISIYATTGAGGGSN